MKKRPKYAAGTGVATGRSKAEIETLLRKHGADQLMSGSTIEESFIMFRMNGKMVKMEFRMPQPEDEYIKYTAAGRYRDKDQIQAAILQEERRLWRVLLITIKAKMETIDSGLYPFEQEFMSHLMLPDGSTLGGFMGPQIEQMYETGAAPSGITALLGPRRD